MAKIGKNLIEMLLFSMYPDPKIIYREYVQNAFDAISKAVQEGILDQTKDGLINISISGASQSIIIRDNGCGISRDDISVLIDLANSTKNGVDTAGLYGIGRLVGAGYCEKLIFRTSSKGENTTSVVTIDSNMARSIIADKNNKAEAQEVMTAISSIISEYCNSDEHFFEVELFKVSAAYAFDLLNEDNVIEYLKDVAPIDYSTVFKKAVIASSIESQPEYEDFYASIPYVTICVNGDTDIRKRYGLKVDGTAGKIGGEDDRILKLEFFTLEDKKYGVLAKGWFAVTKFSVAINESNKSRGIRLRMHNIQIGDSQYLDQYHKEKRGNTYFYGEIHTVNTNLKPTTDRSALAPTEEAKTLFKLIRDQFLSLYYLYSNANKAKSKVAEIHTKVINIGASKSEQETDSEINIITKNVNELERIQKANDKAPKKAMETVLGAYKSAADDEIQSNAEISKKVNEKRHKETSPSDCDVKEKESHIISEPNTVTSPQRPITDIFAPLKNKYSPEDIRLIRKCYMSFTKNCPMQYKKDMMSVWADAIKDLEKDVR